MPVRLFFYTSDEGPDQESFKAFATVEAMPNLFTVFIPCKCMMHVVQLVLRSGLRTCDRWLSSMGYNWKYYSSIAKLTNVWRENGRRFMVRFMAMYGSTITDAVASKLPHRCQAGRWSSVFETEKFYLKCGRARLKAVIPTVFAAEGGHGADAGDGAVRGAGAGGAGGGDHHAEEEGGALAAIVNYVDDPAIEDQVHRRQTMGRWRREVCEVSQEEMFWNIMEIHHRVAAVVEHHMAFLSQVVGTDFIAHKGGKICRLVTGKASEIMSEYAAILINTEWMDTIIDHTPVANFHDILRLIVELTGHHAASYFRRVVSTLDTCFA
jgi:hypothetical protein